VTGRRRKPARTLPGSLAVILAVVLTAIASASASGSVTRPSLPTIERQVMCVSCKIPLNVAQSPQANRERVFIQGLINQGESEAQIKSALVSQYGPAVLGLPSADGFDLAAYLVPLVVVLALLALLLTLLPRWRRHARAQSGQAAISAPLSVADNTRLDSDLAHFDR